MNIAENFIHTARRLADKPFLVAPDGTVHTYAAALGRARRFAGLLRTNGVGPGDRVFVIDSGNNRVMFWAVER